MNETTQQVEDTVRQTIESGDDIYQKVRDITLRALTERELDRENIAAVLTAVGNGIIQGIDAQYDSSRKILDQSTQAMDDALASTAEATKLAVEEAASKVHDFSQHDVKTTMDDLQGLESLFLETLHNIVKESRGAAAEVAADLLNHARTKGTAVGARVESTLFALRNTLVQGESNVLASAKETTSTLAKIGSGILAGIADSLSADKK